MRARGAALVLLPVAWVLVTPATADGAAPRADAGHETVWPTLAPSTDEHADHSEHDATAPADGHDDHGPPVQEADRPLGLVLGVFGGVNGAVVVSAAVLRRREREARRRRQGERSRRRAVPAATPGSEA